MKPGRPRALAAGPALAAGIEHQRAGRLDAASACYRKVLAADPGHPEAAHRLGLIACQQGRPDEGARLFGQALRRDPGNAGLHNNLALALMELGRHAEAVTHCDRAIALRAGYAAAFSNRGIALRALGRTIEAEASLRQAVALQPAMPEAQMNLGLALLDLQQPEAALASFDRALALRPDYVEALSNRGIALLDLERPAEALASLDQAAVLRPDLADVHCNRGNALRDLERLEEALASYDRALALRPSYARAIANRALVLLDQDRPELALECVERALALEPDMAEAYATRGAALCDLGRMREAPEHYARAIALEPGNQRLALYFAVACLRVGRMRDGWQYYDRRWLRGPAGEMLTGTYKLSGVLHTWARSFPQPRWRGEALGGRTLLVHADQGFGDTIQFCRYLPMLAARARAQGAPVLFEVTEPQLSLLAGAPGMTAVLAYGTALPPFDLHCALTDLPGIFGTELDSIPPPPGWLRPDPDRVRQWAARLPRDRRMRIGLAWSGSRGHRADRARSITLEMLRPLAGCDAAFYVLHKDVREADVAEIARFPNLLSISADFADFADTAAAVSQLDLVISVDTSIAHLAGTLGVPTWVMLPYVPDWRWLTDREDSPWYPSVRLFRQRRRRDWGEVIQRVRLALDGLLARHAGGSALRSGREAAKLDG